MLYDCSGKLYGGYDCSREHKYNFYLKKQNTNFYTSYDYNRYKNDHFYISFGLK